MPEGQVVDLEVTLTATPPNRGFQRGLDALERGWLVALPYGLGAQRALRMLVARLAARASSGTRVTCATPCGSSRPITTSTNRTRPWTRPLRYGQSLNRSLIALPSSSAALRIHYGECRRLACGRGILGEVWDSLEHANAARSA